MVWVYAICMATNFRRCLAIFLALVAAPVAAQRSDVPYWASISAEKANMRVGPATSYRIEWVYKRPQLPVKVVRREEGWRLVEDPDGARGWMLGRFLSRERTAMVNGDDLADFRDGPLPDAHLYWRLEPGVIGKLGDCKADWCEFELNNRKGYVPADSLWGLGEP